jgi:hypothetical protein
MTNTEHHTEHITHATWILERAGYFVIHASDNNPIINLVAVNNKHTLLIRVKKVDEIYDNFEDLVKDQALEVDMLSNLRKPDDVFTMIWILYDDNRNWQRYLLNDRGLLEIYETI